MINSFQHFQSRWASEHIWNNSTFSDGFLKMWVEKWFKASVIQFALCNVAFTGEV